MNDWGLKEYMVVHGRARPGGGWGTELLQRLATTTYLGPDVVFPTMPDPPPGVVMRTSIDRVGGMGAWTENT